MKILPHIITTRAPVGANKYINIRRKKTSCFFLFWFIYSSFGRGSSLDFDLTADQLEGLVLHAGLVGDHPLWVCCRLLLGWVFDLLPPASIWVFEYLRQISCFEKSWMSLFVSESVTNGFADLPAASCCSKDRMRITMFHMSVYPSHASQVWHCEKESYLQSRRPPPVAARRAWGAQVSHSNVDGPVFT